RQPARPGDRRDEVAAAGAAAAPLVAPRGQLPGRHQGSDAEHAPAPSARADDTAWCAAPATAWAPACRAGRCAESAAVASARVAAATRAQDRMRDMMNLRR